MAKAREESEPPSATLAEVAPGILRCQLPVNMPGLGHVNAYLLIDDRGATLVDAGVPGEASWTTLVARLADAGLRANDVHTVVVTHSHPDHFGGAHRLAGDAGAKLVTHGAWQTRWGRAAGRTAAAGERTAGAGERTAAAGERTAGAGERTAGAGERTAAAGERTAAAGERTAGAGERTAGAVERTAGAVGGHDCGAELPDIDPADVPTANPWTEPTPWGKESFLAGWLRDMPERGSDGSGWFPPEPDRGVTDGEVLTMAGRQWSCLYTPGHTLDHLCLYDREEGVLLSGDHVLPTITPHIPGIAGGRDALASYLVSLDRVAGLGEVAVVLPAHGQPFSDLVGRVADIKAHHAGRLDRLCKIAESIGPASVVEYSHELFREARWGPMAESETYAHLEHLRLVDRLARRGTGSEMVYELNLSR